MVFVLTGRLHDALLYGKLPIAKLFLLAGALLFFMSNGMQALTAAMRTLPARGFAALTLAILASVPFSVLKSRSFDMSTGWLYATLPIVIIVATSMRSVADLERVLRAFVLMIIASAALILAGLGTSVMSADGPRMSLAGSYDPNDFAAVIAASTAACLWTLRGRSGLWKLLGALGLLSSAFLIVKTGSRGGGLALGLLLIGTTIFVPRFLTRATRVGVLIALAAGLAFVPTQFVGRMASIGDISSDYNMTSPSGRKAVWTRGVGYMARSPLVGVGAGAFPIADGRWAEENGVPGGFKWSAAHNIFIETGAELGIPGLVALLCCLLPIVFTWRRIRTLPAQSESDERLQGAIETVALMTLTFMVGMSFVNGLYGPLLHMLTAMSIAAHVLLRHSGLAKGGASHELQSVKSRSRQPIGLVAATVAPRRPTAST
jgi:O-antigen ligase